MKRTLLIALIAILAAGCGKPTSKEPELQENTEEYFAAHGIVPGQVNELRIGGTLFRFPAGVGLNPYTAQEQYRSKDGSPMTLSTKEGVEQGKYEKVETPIVKGRADKVTFYLNPDRSFLPIQDSFASGMMIRVEISNGRPAKWDGVNVNPDEFMKNIKGMEIIHHSRLGLRQFITPTKTGTEYYESFAPIKNDKVGQGKFFWCQSNAHGISTPTGLCFISYWNDPGQYTVEIITHKSIFIERWQEIYSTANHFVDSVAVK